MKLKENYLGILNEFLRREDAYRFKKLQRRYFNEKFCYFNPCLHFGKLFFCYLADGARFSDGENTAVVIR